MSRTSRSDTVASEIRKLTGYLVEHGLADDQNYPVVTSGRQRGVNITYPSSGIGPAHLKDRRYADTYAVLLDARAYNVRLLDGAMLQLSYSFVDGELLKHRLAFLPHPELPLFQNTPEEYLEDALYADVLDHRIVCVPLRFDFDRTSGVAQDVTYPVGHLTLSQYAGCRIAATTALTPFDFVELILRAFYNTAARSITTDLPARVLRPGELHANTITRKEGALAHIGVPE